MTPSDETTKRLAEIEERNTFGVPYRDDVQADVRWLLDLLAERDAEIKAYKAWLDLKDARIAKLEAALRLYDEQFGGAWSICEEATKEAIKP